MTERVLVPADAKVPFNDLAHQWRAIRPDLDRDFAEIFERSAYCLGPFVDMFEEEAARWLGSGHAVGVNSGTSALHLAAIAAGIGPGDEVLVPAHTFVGTVWGILYVGATPVLCDVERETGNIDLADAARRVTPRTKAVIPVHLYGQPADMDAVAALADAHRLVAIEDAAQAIGARWRGRRVGTLGALGCVSFYPGKNLGAAGEAGLVVTQDPALAERLRSLRNHGQSTRYLHEEVGYNYRLDGLQAAVLRRKLALLEGWTDERRRLAARYAEGLADLPLDLPATAHEDHVWHLYVVRSDRRDELREHLAGRGIETGLHYPVPLHRQPCLQAYVAAGDSFPVADDWSRRCLSLPLFVGMSDAQQDRVVHEVGAFLRHG